MHFAIRSHHIFALGYVVNAMELHGWNSDSRWGYWVRACVSLCVAYAVGEGGGCGGKTARNAANLIYSYCLVFSSSDSQTLCPTGFAIIALHLTAKWFPFPSLTHTHMYTCTRRQTHKRVGERERVPLQERQRVRHIYFKSELCVRAQQVWA